MVVAGPCSLDWLREGSWHSQLNNGGDGGGGRDLVPMINWGRVTCTAKRIAIELKKEAGEGQGEGEGEGQGEGKGEGQGDWKEVLNGGGKLKMREELTINAFAMRNTSGGLQRRALICLVAWVVVAGMVAGIAI